MSESSTAEAAVQTTTETALDVILRQAEAPEAEAPEQDEKQLNTLLKRCESAFT